MSLEKVLVVGAGLGGLLTSHILLKKGFNVELFEEHGSIGLPRHCSGLVSDYVVSFLGGLIKDYILGRFTEYSVKIIDEETREVLTLSFKKPVYLIDRVEFERSLGELIAGLGGEVSVKTIVTDVNLNKNYLVTNNRELCYYDLVVISEGATRRLVKTLNLCRVSKYLIGSQALLSVNRSPETVEVLVSPLLGPEGFGWSIPIDEKHVILGLSTISRKASLILKYLAKKIFRSSYKVENFFGGLIPADRPCEKIAGENYLLVGDATSTIKPVSRGGIYSLVEEIASLKDSLSKDSLNQDLIASKYKKLLSYLKTQYFFYEIILSAGGYYKLVRSMSKSGLREIRILDYDKLLPELATTVLLVSASKYQ